MLAVGMDVAGIVLPYWRYNSMENGSETISVKVGLWTMCADPGTCSDIKISSGIVGKCQYFHRNDSNGQTTLISFS